MRLKIESCLKLQAITIREGMLMFCYKCGMKIDEKDVFCKRCGANQKTNASSNSANHSNPSGGKGNKLLEILTCVLVGNAANKKIESLGIGIPRSNPNAKIYKSKSHGGSRKKK